MQNVGPLSLVFSVFGLSFSLTVGYLLKYKTLGVLSEGWVYNASRALHVWVSLVFLASFLNVVFFLLDPAFDNSWAAWPYAGLQALYALLWILMLWTEWKNLFSRDSVWVQLLLFANYFTQLSAFVVLAVAVSTASNKGIGYLTVQIILTLHTTSIDYLFYIAKFYF